VIEQAGVGSVDDVRRHPQRLIGPSKEVLAATGLLRQYLHRSLYNNPALAPERERGVEIVKELFEFYMAHAERLPKSYAELAQQQPRHRIVCDYIAGMTDSYIQKVYRELRGSA
jgi:dGTPase